MSENKIRALAILLDSPMQSWGSDSRFRRRETEAFPTKSALLGMLAAASGIDKHADDESERLAPLAALRLGVYRLPRKRGRLVQRLSDFHTVGGGYDTKASAFQKMSIPAKAKPPCSPSANAVITHRSYLTEVRFIAAFEGAPAIIDPLILRLRDPVWGVWFGRKTCLPAMPLSPEPGTNLHAAVRHLLERLEHWEKGTARDSLPKSLDPARLERWEEPAEDDSRAGDFFIQDQPVSFRRREFHARPVRCIRGDTGISGPE